MKAVKLLIALFLPAVLCGPVFAKEQPVDAADLAPDRNHQQATIIISKVIDRYHYKKQLLDDKWSAEIFDRYLESLDPNRSFFLQQDIDRFAQYRPQLDDSIREARLQPAFDIFLVYRQRVEERVDYALRLLEQAPDFTVDEDYVFDREDAPWPADLAASNDLWRKRVKNDILSLRLADKKPEDIRETLQKRYAGIARRVRQLDADDVFQSFINSYTLTLEPHTSYMSPMVSENFDISMRLSLEGIGAVLRTEDEYTEVQSVISGGPAKLSGKLDAGDRIVGVGQGPDSPITDVVGWRLDDVVKLIRGPKGTLVRLQVIPKGAVASGSKRKVVSLVRDKIKLEEQAAKKRVIEGLDGMAELKVGVIEVPTFYRDFQAEARGDDKFRSTTRDVRALIQELEAEGVAGIVIDLRDNGGGSLTEATELTGLFIDTGPVVQVRDAAGEIEVETDNDAGVAYAGPMAVLVNRNSASASEIFAGAIQDYHRGIIIGEPTFGKGTVQTLVDLDRFVRGNNPHLGRLRLTMAQFFRINGTSTQHRGVVPDIVFPTALGAADHGERALDNALPWARVQPARYSPEGSGGVFHVREHCTKRIETDPGFQLLLAEERLIAENRDRTQVSLMESKRRAELDEREKLTREYKARFRLAKGLPALPEDDAEADEEDEVITEARKKESEAVSLIQVEEAARVLADYIGDRRRLVATVKN